MIFFKSIVDASNCACLVEAACYACVDFDTGK